uniref:Uncharacterized protein n=1 Tax=Parastrongyloides trichosuri TaxID=131310 RepID=A0A0N4ZV80_PARTI
MRYCIIAVCCFTLLCLIFIIPIIEGLLRKRSLENRKKKRSKCLQCKIMGKEFIKKIELEDDNNVDCCFTCFSTIPACPHDDMELSKFIRDYIIMQENERIRRLRENSNETKNGTQRKIDEESLF